MPANSPPYIPPICNDKQRLAALRRYGILDTPPEQAFDDIARLVAHVCQTPVALVSFVDEHRQWFKAEVGMGVRETPLDLSICAHAILRKDLFVVHDTLEDEVFRENPVVKHDPHLRFYAGAQLITPDGQALGTLCVLDYVPRSLTPQQQDALRALARQVVSQLELRQALAAQRATAETLVAARRAAEQANRAKDDFLATVSHELRTPLSAILLWANILRGHRLEPKQLEEGLATILASAKSQQKLIDDLLDTARIAAGKIRLNPQDVDVGALAVAAAETILPAAEAKGVSVETEGQGGGIVVSADADRLRQVLWNLLTNAVKFTPAGGRVRVKVEADGASARLRVVDTGQGIGAGFLPRVFEPFTQADAGDPRHPGGLGLGLAIAKNLVELHGGTIRAESPGPGRGATFTVELPLRDASPAAPGAAAPTAAPARSDDAGRPALGGTRVLLVEDDAATRGGLVAVLEHAGGEVVAVESVAAALEAFARARPDVLVSDVGLPDGDGYGLVRKIRAAEAASGGRTPAVAVTAYAGGRDHQLALEAGFDTHLPKPADPAELLEVIANLAAAAGARID